MLSMSTVLTLVDHTDDTTYDTVFSTVSQDTLILRVHFPATDPGATVIRAPDMQLKGVTATHPWLDSIGRVTGFDPISSERSFRESRKLLGEAVKEVVQQLQLNPPTVIEFTDSHLADQQPKKRTSEKRQNPPPTNDDSPPSYDTVLNNASPPRQSVNLPSIPAQFPDLEGMDRDALDELLNNEVVFLDYCNNLPVTSELQQLETEKREQVDKLAAENLSRQSEMQELHESTKRLHEKLQTTVEEFQALEKQQDTLQEKPDPSTLIRELNKAKKKAFDESEKLADDWLDKGDKCEETMDEFCRTFLEIRKIHHVRAAKIQILSHQPQK